MTSQQPWEGPEGTTTDRDQTEGGARVRRRMPRNLIVGTIVGAVAGAILGGIVGVAIGGLGGAIVGLLVGGFFAACCGALVGGYGSLESPQPGREPSQTDHPIADVPEMTTEEHPGTHGTGRPSS
jgi:predicted lipid-binding transport protein (Tim44 family)